jgi:hypothetical protein
MKNNYRFSSRLGNFLVCFFLISSSILSYASEKFRVIDADTEKGLRSSIVKVSPDNKEVKVSVTGDNGYILVDFKCDLLEKIIITADDSSYYQESINCPLGTEYIALRSAIYTFNLVANAELSIRKGDLGTAVFAYNEAAWRAAKFEPKTPKTTALELKAYETVGSFLSVSESTVFDVKQNKVVMTPKLTDALRRFQNARGLKADGKLNFETVQGMSNLPLSKILFYRQLEN